MKKLLCLFICICGFFLKAVDEELDLKKNVRVKRVAVTVLLNVESQNFDRHPTPDLGPPPFSFSPLENCSSQYPGIVGCLTPLLQSPSQDTKK